MGDADRTIDGVERFAFSLISYAQADIDDYQKCLRELHALQDTHECDLVGDESKEIYRGNVADIMKKMPESLKDWHETSDDPVLLTEAEKGIVCDATKTDAQISMVLRECRSGPVKYKFFRSRNINCGCLKKPPYVPDGEEFKGFCKTTWSARVAPDPPIGQ